MASITSVVSLPDVATLKLLTTRPELVMIQDTGYSYAWLSGSTATADGVAVVQCVTGPAGRYLLLSDNSLNATIAGVVGDGVTDDTVALQAALNAMVASGNRFDLFIPPAFKCLISAPLTMTNPANAPMRGPIIWGGGTIKPNFSSAGSALKIRGIRAVAPVGFNNCFLGGGFRNIIIEGSLTTAHAVVGLEHLGWLGATFDSLTIQNMSSHGEFSNWDSNISGTPDLSASASIRRVNCIYLKIQGNALHTDTTQQQSAPGMILERCQIDQCKLSGVLMASDGFVSKYSSYAGCGWDVVTGVASARAYAIEMTYGNRLETSGNEFQANLTAHIGFGHCSDAMSENDRFIHADSFSSGTGAPANSVQFGINSGSDICTGVSIRRPIVRLDAVTGTKNVTLVSYINTSSGNVHDNDITFCDVQDNDGSGWTITPVSGFNSSGNSYNFNNKIDIRFNHAVASTQVYTLLPGSGLPYVSAHVPGSTAFSGSLVAFPATSVDHPNSTSDSPWFSSYNTSTCTFTCPAPGTYAIHAYVMATGIATSENIHFQTQQAGSTYNDWYTLGAGSVQSSLEIREVIPNCAAGSTIGLKYQSNAASPSNIVWGVVEFEMVKGY